MPVAGRVAVFAGWWACVAAALAAFLLVPALRRPSLDTVAVLIERAIGGMHNRLLTVIDLARELLGWEPKVSLDEGLEPTIAWFRTTTQQEINQNH